MRKRPIRTMRIESHRVRSPVEPIRSWSPRWCECAVSVLHTHGCVCVCVCVKLCVGIGVGVDVGGRGEERERGPGSRAEEQSRAEQSTAHNPYQVSIGSGTKDGRGETG